MLKVYSVHSYVSVNNGKWYEVGSTGIAMMDETKSKEVIIDNGSFDEWCKYLQENRLDGIYYGTTFFKKKPCIITHEWYYDYYEKYTHFDTLLYKDVYKEMPNVSLNYIMENFSADKCIQYLKERGMTACPMNF